MDDAVAKGATVLTGGHPLPEVGPLAYAPTVLTDVTEDMTLCREETFGPVVSVYRVADADEAAARADDTRLRPQREHLGAGARRAPAGAAGCTSAR